MVQTLEFGPCFTLTVVRILSNKPTPKNFQRSVKITGYTKIMYHIYKFIMYYIHIYVSLNYEYINIGHIPRGFVRIINRAMEKFHAMRFTVYKLYLYIRCIQFLFFRVNGKTRKLCDAARDAKRFSKIIKSVLLEFISTNYYQLFLTEKKNH